MPFEHSIRYIIKKLPMKSTSIGFYHSLVTKEFMAYHHSQSEWNSSIKPDYVACMGKISENLLIDQGVPKQKILSVAALRQLKHENELENKKNRNQILILLSMSMDACAEILTKVYLNNHVITDELKLKVRVKLHPMVKIKNLFITCDYEISIGGYSIITSFIQLFNFFILLLIFITIPIYICEQFR